MAGRIRTLKPEWLGDEKLMPASADARVLSVALILLADDYGNGSASDLYLAGHVWGAAADPMEALATCKAALTELADLDFVTLYYVNRQRYYHVTNWSKHQRVDKPGRPQVPGPGRADAAEVSGNTLANDSRMAREPVANGADGESRTARESLAPDRDREEDKEREGDARARVMDEPDPPVPRSADVRALWDLQEQLRGELDMRPLAMGHEQEMRVFDRLKRFTREQLEHSLRVHHRKARSNPKERDWFDGKRNWADGQIESCLGQSVEPPESTAKPDPYRGYEVCS